jgi:hypothetical protein
VIEHDLSNLLRRDMKARLEAYDIGIRAEIWSPNEYRLWEGMNRRDGGDTYCNPVCDRARTSSSVFGRPPGLPLLPLTHEVELRMT